MSSFLHDSLVFLLLVVFIFYVLTSFLLFVGRNLDDSHFNSLVFSAFIMLYGFVGAILLVLLLLLLNQ